MSGAVETLDLERNFLDGMFFFGGMRTILQNQRIGGKRGREPTPTRCSPTQAEKFWRVLQSPGGPLLCGRKKKKKGSLFPGGLHFFGDFMHPETKNLWPDPKGKKSNVKKPSVKNWPRPREGTVAFSHPIIKEGGEDVFLVGFEKE